MKRKVIGIGETVLDIIFRGEQPIAAVPGGSTYNSIISLGRCGARASFISETGDDRVGRRIAGFLEENGVSSESVFVHQGQRSPLSLAFLNEANDAEYVFYKDHARDELYFKMPEIEADDVVLFGSYYALNPVVRDQVKAFLDYARDRGAIIYYDINFRASHKAEAVKLRSNLLENLELADIVRASEEDCQLLFGLTDADRLFRQELSFYTDNFILTRGSQPIELRAKGGGGPALSLRYEARRIEKVVSTIGAGDSFNAGVAFALLRDGLTRQSLHDGLRPGQWDALIGSGQDFAADVCQSLDNYVSLDFASQRRQQLASG